ncbi:hypothetical protein [Halalkalibacterium halodurans]|uniref:Uncharacterized protein n=2 Tax=Halalkalibacterium halodurans TaxID=86665 RepID=A0A0M0KN46_ALKHA|nr:hypothetical protein [Halalkalibacterium halodurans]TPE68216.1 hypothetical protein AMD02_014730 [Halalkalibacterium halodurans]
MNLLEEKKIALSTDEMIVALALCGYEDVAREASLLKRDMTEEQIDALAYHAERLLKHRGYWNEERPTQLAQEVEDLIHAMMKAPKKIRCVYGQYALLFHHLADGGMIVQRFEGMDHMFTIINHNSDYVEHLIDFYGLPEEKPTEGIAPFAIERELFDSLDTFTDEEMDAICEDEGHPISFRSFLKDFQERHAVLDSITFMFGEETEEDQRDEPVYLFLRGKSCVWVLDYSFVTERDEIDVYSVEMKEYLKLITEEELPAWLERN